MVQIKKDKLIITIETAFPIEELQAIQNASISAMVSFAREEDFDYSNESYYLSTLLQSLQPEYEVLRTGFNNTPPDDFIRLKQGLTTTQKEQVKNMVIQFEHAPPVCIT